jgi:hypothetical protein
VATTAETNLDLLQLNIEHFNILFRCLFHGSSPPFALVPQVCVCARASARRRVYGATCLQGPFLFLQRPQLQQKKIERRLQRFQLEASIIASIGLPLFLSPPLLSPLPLSFLSSPQRGERERRGKERREGKREREKRKRGKRERRRTKIYLQSTDYGCADTFDKAGKRRGAGFGSVHAHTREHVGVDIYHELCQRGRPVRPSCMSEHHNVLIAKCARLCSNGKKLRAHA